MTAVLSTFQPKVEPTGRGDREVADMLTQTVLDYDRADPRSQQRSIGLSEIGHPCPRKIAYKLSGMPEPENLADDPWLRIIGTAVHAWLSKAFHWRNEQEGYERFIIDRRVWLTPNTPGSLDLFDRATGTLIDPKIVGKTKLTEYRKKGPSPEYRVQVHSYGEGLRNEGIEVRKVALAFFPRTTYITKALHVWSEDHDPAVPAAALQRINLIQALINKLNPVANPILFAQIPKTPGPNCAYCPFYMPGADTGATCPGQ